MKRILWLSLFLLFSCSKVQYELTPTVKPCLHCEIVPDPEVMPEPTKTKVEMRSATILGSHLESIFGGADIQDKPTLSVIRDYVTQDKTTFGGVCAPFRLAQRGDCRSISGDSPSRGLHFMNSGVVRVGAMTQSCARILNLDRAVDRAVESALGGSIDYRNPLNEDQVKKFYSLFYEHSPSESVVQSLVQLNQTMTDSECLPTIPCQTGMCASRCVRDGVRSVLYALCTSYKWQEL